MSVYVHVPWCVQNAHIVTLIRMREVVYPKTGLQALEADLIHHLPYIWGRTIQTVFIGGGTPSLLSAQAMERLITLLRNLWASLQILKSPWRLILVR